MGTHRVVGPTSPFDQVVPTQSMIVMNTVHMYPGPSKNLLWSKRALTYNAFCNSEIVNGIKTDISLHACLSDYYH